MADFIDKAILLGTGVEKKLKELVNELEEEGQKEKSKTKDSEEGKAGKLPPKERLENRIVNDSVGALKEIITLLKEGKAKIESEIFGGAETISEKLNIATKTELETVKEMARIAREKADLLEKRLTKIEEKKD
jgi:BMFP domain-containing protein YqiC